MELTPARLEQIRQLIEEELQKVYRDALDDGVSPVTLRAAIADRRRDLEALTRQLVADDPQNAVDEAGHGGGVGQQR